jgi:hypothetical protein
MKAKNRQMSTRDITEEYAIMWVAQNSWETAEQLQAEGDIEGATLHTEIAERWEEFLITGELN